MDKEHVMKQYRELKAKHPDVLLLFRCGDFYVSYEDDAVEAAHILGITLTKSRDGYKMAGFPYHALDTYLPKIFRAGKRVAICDQLTPTNDQTKTTQTTKSMEKNIKAADLIGKTIVNKDGSMSYRVMNVDGDKLTVEFKAGDRPAVTMPMPTAQVEKLLAGGWTIAGAGEKTEQSDAPKSEKPAADVSGASPSDAPKQQKPKAEKTQEQPKQQKPKAEKKQEQPKQEKPKAENRYTYSTYTNAKGKTCARINGINEGDAAYQNAGDLHASASYERDKKGNKKFFLIFGPRYADAAKQVCDARNAGKSVADCKAIIDAATEERIAKREEWKAKRAAYNEGKAQTEQQGKTYSEAEVLDLLKRLAAGDKEAQEQVKRMTAA